MRKWIDIFALLMAGLVIPATIIAVAYVFSRDNATDSKPTPPPSVSISAPSSTTTAPPT